MKDEIVGATNERGEGRVPGLGELPISDHLLMVNDVGRSEKYFQAMSAKIRPGDVVLEVGTGAGLLTCMAVSLGAKHVYTVERSRMLHDVAKKVFEKNRIAHKVTLINAASDDLLKLAVIRDPIDVFVTETIGTIGLEEGIATIFDHVRPFLAPGAKLIPETLQFKQCLVNLTGIRERFQILAPIFGFDLSALNDEIRSNQLFWMNPIEPWREVSSTSETPIYDLAHLAPSESSYEMFVISDNVCDGMFTWSEFRLADNVFIDTRYRQPGDSWANCIHLSDRTNVCVGQRCTSTFRINDDRLGWVTNWRIEASQPLRDAR